MSNEHELIIEGQSLQYSQDDEKRHWLFGVVAMVDHRGKNGRVYPRSMMESAVQTFITEKVDQGAGFAELDHPQSPTVSLQNACVRIVELWFEGADLHAKMLILDTTQGRNLLALLDRGGRVGASTRARGELDSVGNVRNLTIEAIDIVSAPANTDGRLMDHVYEGTQPLNRTDNIDGLDSTVRGKAVALIRRKKRKWLAERGSDLKNIRVNKATDRGRAHVDVSPQLKDKRPEHLHSPAAVTTHPKRRGQQGRMKNEAEMKLTKKDRYLDSKDNNKGDSAFKNPYQSKHKPKFLKPSGSRVKLESELVEDLLQAIVEHLEEGHPIFEAAMLVGENFLAEASQHIGTSPIPNSAKAKPQSAVKRPAFDAGAPQAPSKPSALPRSLGHATSKGGSLGMSTVAGIGQAVSKAHQAGLTAKKKGQ